MLVSEQEHRQPKPEDLREDDTDQTWIGSEGWSDGTLPNHSDDQQGQFRQKSANIPAPMSSSENVAREKTMETGCSDGLPEQEEAIKYKSKYCIFLCSVEQLRKQMGAIEAEKAQVKPRQLSTMKTAKEINNLTTADLIDSIKEICYSSRPFTREQRKKSIGFHNWVLVDLCRRMQVIQQRFIRRYKGRAEDEMRVQVISAIAGAQSIETLIRATPTFATTLDGDFFDLFPLFVEWKRTQILAVAGVIGDEICALTEFIDMKEIGDMDPDDHLDFLHDLRLSKARMELVIEAVKDSNAFHGDPTTSYDRVEFLDEETL